MTEIAATGSSTRKMSKQQLQQLIKKMNKSTSYVPIIEKAAQRSSKNERKTAEEQLEKFLNS